MHITLTNLFQLILAAQLSAYIALTIKTSRLLPFALLLTTLCVHMMTNFLVDIGIVAGDFDITFSFRFLYGPLLYLMVREIIKNSLALDFKDLLHGIPFLLAIPIASAYFLFDILGIVSLCLYFFLTIRLVRRVKRSSANVVSTPGAGRVDWIQSTAIGMILITIFDVSHLMASKYYAVFNSQLLPQLTLVFLLALLNRFAYKAIRYPEEFEGFTTDDIVQLQPLE